METRKNFFQTKQEQENSNKFVNDESLDDSIQLVITVL